MNDQVSATEPEMLATFEICMRDDASVEEVATLQGNLLEIAKSSPTIGEIEARSYAGENGAVLILYKFKSKSALDEFVRHPEHLAVMRRGKEFFKSGRTQIATLVKQSETTYD